MPPLQIDVLVAPGEVSLKHAEVSSAIDCASDHRPIIGIIGTGPVEDRPVLRGARKPLWWDGDIGMRNSFARIL
eukprot:1949457-Alexandrium_andersonii.AAC.1